jgi:hypothetical protein
VPVQLLRAVGTEHAGGVALGWDRADPVVGLLITVAILAVLRQAGREISRPADHATSLAESCPLVRVRVVPFGAGNRCTVR